MVYELIMTYLICFMLICCFFIMGVQVNGILKLNHKGLYHIVCGFFVYFILFEIFYLPSFILKISVTALSICWMTFLGLDMVISIVLFRKTLLPALKEMGNQFRCNSWACVIIAAIVFGCVMYCTTRTFYYGYDTAYYLGMVNSAVHYDRMLLYDSEMGHKRDVLDLRYGLSGFYMHTAVMCRTFKISAIMMQKQGMTIINVLMSYCIIFLIGRKLFKKEVKYAYLFTAVYFFINLFFLSDFAVGTFLIYRAYEAKAYCCNVVIPAVLLVMYSMMRSRDIQGYRWRQLGIYAMASIPVSMSSILIIPVMVMAFACSMAVIHRRFRYVLYGCLCSSVNMVSLIVYYLYVVGKLVIKI